MDSLLHAWFNTSCMGYSTFYHCSQLFMKTSYTFFFLSYDCSSSMKYFIFLTIEFDQKMYLVMPLFSWTTYVTASVLHEVICYFPTTHWRQIEGRHTNTHRCIDTSWQLHQCCSWITPFCNRTENEKVFTMTMKICQRDSFRLRWSGADARHENSTINHRGAWLF